MVFPPPIAQALADFPYEVLLDGCCSQLLPNGRCAVYETRPMLCNYEASWPIVAPHLPFADEREFRIWSISICHQLQENYRGTHQQGNAGEGS